MNRAERSAAQRQQPVRVNSLSLNYGHNGQVVVVTMTQKIDNLTLTERQVDEMIEGLQVAKAALINHKATAAREGGHGNA